MRIVDNKPEYLDGEGAGPTRVEPGVCLKSNPSPLLRAFTGGDHANPKDLLGEKKVSISKLPPVAVLHAAHAMMNGAAKYGTYNWRTKAVRASIYVDAAHRHLDAWFDGEEIASDSGVHHLGHAIACMAILLDAQETGNLVDDRPAEGCGAFARVLDRLSAAWKARHP